QITDRTLKIIKESPMILDHLHIPIQSGSQNILTLMKRTYTKEEFINKIKLIKETIPGIAITTDIIIGFPKESEADFNETIATIKQCGFMQMHVFPYSKRSNTLAASFDGHIDDATKNKRVETIIDLSKQLEYSYALNYLDQELDIIVEGYDSDTGYSHGHSGNYLEISIKAQLPLGQLVQVKVIDVHPNYIEGVLV
ncbi:MAG: radical SAM protein, partial [Bacilli bacterium]